MAAPSRGRTRGTLIALGIALALASPGARAASLSEVENGFEKVGEDAFDLVVLRPFGTVALLVGSVFFTASLPAVTPYQAWKGTTDGIRASYDVFVYPPYEYTVLRDLGDF